MLCRKNEKASFYLLFYRIFYMTKLVNNKKCLRYFHKSEKHLERVYRARLNLFPEYYNYKNVRLIYFNDCITVYILYTTIMLTRSSRYLSTGDTPYPHKHQRVLYNAI